MDGSAGAIFRLSGGDVATVCMYMYSRKCLFTGIGMKFVFGDEEELRKILGGFSMLV